jgi:hypothetical protein
MRPSTIARIGAALLLAPLGSGCTALRELPREQYAAKPERRHLVIETRNGERHRLDRARFSADSLVGFRRRDAQPDSVALRLALDDVARLSAHQVDWYRSGLVGGVVMAGVLAAVLAGGKHRESPPPPGPCVRCPQ